MADGTDKAAGKRDKAQPKKIARRYGAFISYSHADKAHVEASADPKAQGFPIWLHRKLESYVVPAGLRREYKKEGVDLPKRIGRCFRDDDEFGSEEDLKSAIETALGRADNLIVICSPRSAASAYVNDEVRTFKHKNQGANVFAVILDGKPHNAERECFPQALKHEVGPDGAITAAPAAREPVAADVQEFDRDTVFFKLVAGILGIEYGRLRDREKQAERAKRRQAAGVLASGIGLSALALFGLFGVTRLMSGLGQRTSTAMAELAFDANEANDYERAARFALVGVNGHDAPLIGFDASAARTELTRAVLASQTIYRHRDSRTGSLYAYISPDGQWLATYDEYVRQGRLLNLRSKHEFALDPPGVTPIFAFTPDSKSFAAAGERRDDGTLIYTLYSTGDRAGRCTVEVPLELRFSPNSALMVARTRNGFSIHDAATCATVGQFSRELAIELAWSPDSTRLGVTTKAGKALLFDAAMTRAPLTLPAIGEARQIAFSQDGGVIAVGARDGTVSILRGPDFAVARALPTKLSSAYDGISLNDNGSVLLVSSGGIL